MLHRILAYVALGVVFIASAGAASSATEDAAANAAAALGAYQNDDGSWGATDDIRPLYTAAVVDALRAYNERSPAYFRGVTWLENRAMGNVDYHARRAAALWPHGDDVTPDRDFLKASVSMQLQGVSAWGLSAAYAPSARDTASALLAFGVIGVAPDVSADVQAALDYLKSSQAADGSWAVSGATAGDPSVTALVLRALAAHLALDPTVATNGNLAATYLQSEVTAASSALQQARAALALLRWSGPGSATSLIDALVAAQSGDGSWGGDPYTTAVALAALAVELGRDTASFQQVIAIGDFELRSAVNLGLGRNRGDVIRRGDLQELKTLNANGFGISDLSGLEEATNLTFLDLRNTNVSDITPIAGLASTATILLQNTPWAGQACDLNDDGTIDAADLLLSTRIAHTSYTPTLLQKTRADIAPPAGPGDGVVNASDVGVLTRYLTGAASGACP